MKSQESSSDKTAKIGEALLDKVPKIEPSSQEASQEDVPNDVPDIKPDIKSIVKRAVKPIDQPNRSHLYKKVVPWMKKPQYFSAEPSQYSIKSSQIKSNVAYNKPKANKQSILGKDRLCTIKAIEKTFTLVNNPTRKHHSKPGVIAVEEQSLFPYESGR